MRTAAPGLRDADGATSRRDATMNAPALLAALFRCKAWADEQLLARFVALEASAPADECRTAARILDHMHVVDRIFAAHLQRRTHGFAATGSADAPAFAALADAVRESDRWYVGYVEQAKHADLTERIDFRFTDGSAGCMSREEMLAHLITHGAYHRGEAGRILTRLTGTAPRDTFTGYLHAAEPARRSRTQVAPPR